MSIRLGIRTESATEIRRSVGRSLHVRTYIRTDKRTNNGSDVLTPSVCIPKIDGVTTFSVVDHG